MNIENPLPTTVAAGVITVPQVTGLSYVIFGLQVGEWMAIVGFIAVCLSIVVNIRLLFKRKK